MYYMVNSSKGVSSVFLAKWVGVSQKTAWKICHAIREMMRPVSQDSPTLSGIVELDEKYIGSKSRYRQGVSHKRGIATEKQAVFVAVQRYGPVCSALIQRDKAFCMSCPQLFMFCRYIDHFRPIIVSNM